MMAACLLLYTNQANSAKVSDPTPSRPFPPLSTLPAHPAVNKMNLPYVVPGPVCPRTVCLSHVNFLPASHPQITGLLCMYVCA